MSALLECIELETAPNPEWAVIWLHGLGADGSDFVPVVPELGLPDGLGVRFVFPHAPHIPVTCNGGYVMRAWYDIISLEPHSRRIDEAGIVHSRAAVRALIEREKARGIAADRIFLAGFSQGGAVAYATALTHPERLAGIIALSTYLPVVELVAREAAPANRAIPVFAAHGDEDDVVSPSLGRQARDFLLQNAYAVDWHEYPMPHSVCLEEVADIGAWLRSRCVAVQAPTATRDAQFEQGLAMRRQVMGEAFVERAFAGADAFTAPLQEFVTRNAWGTTWCRPGLDLKTRSLLTLSMLTALGRAAELKGHVRGAINNGARPEEIREVLLHAAIYCGMPLAIDAFRSAHEVLLEMGAIDGKS